MNNWHFLFDDKKLIKFCIIVKIIIKILIADKTLHHLSNYEKQIPTIAITLRVDVTLRYTRSLDIYCMYPRICGLRFTDVGFYRRPSYSACWRVGKTFVFTVIDIVESSKFLEFLEKMKLKIKLKKIFHSNSRTL